MANTVSGTLNINKAAFVKKAYYALRPRLYYDNFVDTTPDDVTNNGTSYTWNITSDLAEVTTPVGEEADLTPVTPTDTPVTLTPQEYVNGVRLTALAEATAFMSYRPIIAKLIGFNAGLSADAIARNAFQLGTNAIYAGTGTARATIAVGDVLTGNHVRHADALLEGSNVMDIAGSYIGFMHPDVAYDFKGSTGGTNWSDPHIYGGDQDAIWNGLIGTFQGVRFIQSPRAPKFVDGSVGATGTTNAKTTSTSTASAATTNYSTITTTAAHGFSVGQGVTFSGNGSVGLPANAVIVSVPTTTTFVIAVAGISAGSPSVTVTSGSIDVYRTLIFGEQAFAKAYSQMATTYRQDPIFGEMPVTDFAERFTGVYWKHFVAYGIFRQSALWSIESSSSIGSNA